MVTLFYVFFGAVIAYFTCTGVRFLIVVQKPTVEMGAIHSETAITLFKIEVLYYSFPVLCYLFVNFVFIDMRFSFQSGLVVVAHSLKPPPAPPYR